MTVGFAALLMIISVAGAVALAVIAPLFLGLIAYDVAKTPRVLRSANPHFRIGLQRGVARAFVLGGGLFWSIATFAGLYSYRETGAVYALITALIPLAAVAVTLIVGWYYERVAAVLLALASIAAVAYGVIFQFELGVWILMGFTTLGPMLTASLLFWLARRDQDAFELATNLRPELALIFAARSTIA